MIVNKRKKHILSGAGVIFSNCAHLTNYALVKIMKGVQTLYHSTFKLQQKSQNNTEDAPKTKRLKLVFDSLKDAHILNPTGTQELFNVCTMPTEYHSSVGLAEDSPQQLIHQETNPSAPPGPTRWSDTQFVSRGRVCCVGSPLNSHPSWLVTRLSAALPLPSGGAVTP